MSKVLENKKITVRNAVLLTLSIISSLFLAEILSRIFFPIRFQSLADHSTEEWINPGYFNSANFRPSRSLGYELVPNSALGTNSLGMFDRERTKEKPGDVYRIICMGDSTTAVSDYAYILEDLLNKEEGEKSFEVWNCGVPGYGAIQYYRALKEKWLKYKPDMVLIGFCLNDFDTTPLVVRESDNLVGYFPEREIMPQVNPFLLKHSAVYRFVVMKLLDTKRHDNNEDTAKLVSYHLRDIESLLENEGIRFLIVIFSIVDRFDRYPSWLKNYQQIKNIIAEYNIESIDMVPIFRNYGEENLRLFPGDELHFNKEGAQIIANAIYDYLDKNLIDTGI